MASTPDDHESAFARYQAETRDYVRSYMRLPPGGVKGYAPQSRLMISLRAQSMRMMTRWPMRQLVAGQVGKSDGIVLKEYGTAPMAEPR